MKAFDYVRGAYIYATGYPPWPSLHLPTVCEQCKVTEVQFVHGRAEDERRAYVCPKCDDALRDITYAEAFHRVVPLPGTSLRRIYDGFGFAKAADNMMTSLYGTVLCIVVIGAVVFIASEIFSR